TLCRGPIKGGKAGLTKTLRRYSPIACLKEGEYQPKRVPVSDFRGKPGGPTLGPHADPRVRNPPVRALGVREPPDIWRQAHDTAGMDMDHDACYRAICTRDARFD